MRGDPEDIGRACREQNAAAAARFREERESGRGEAEPLLSERVQAVLDDLALTDARARLDEVWAVLIGPESSHIADAEAFLSNMRTSLESAIRILKASNR